MATFDFVLEQPASGGASTVPLESFFKELKKEVHTALEAEDLPHQGPWQMHVKSVVILLAWLGVYLALLSGAEYGVGLLVAVSIALSVFTSSLQLAIMHDASHKAFAKTGWLNTFMSFTCIGAGISFRLWFHKHVVAHHCHTNVPGEDHDILSGGMFRFHDGDRWRPWHRWQHFYAIPLYSCLALKWIVIDDIVDALSNRFNVDGREQARIWVEIVLSRAAHVVLFGVLPYMALGSLEAWLLFYLVHWMAVGIILAIVFQLAHVTDVQSFPESAKAYHGDWALHQLATTADFAVTNRVLTFLVGGLNFQVEHHIFPRISHIHYPRIQPIVKRFCEDNGVNYYEYRTFIGAIAAHFRHLEQLSARPEIQQAVAPS
jgi:linoleoyl-CoA desaturase